LKDDKHMQDEIHDSTIAALLQHLTTLRQAVPVNYQLKAELKEKLLERIREMERERSLQSGTSTPPRWWKQWWVSAGAAAMVVLLSLVVWCRTMDLFQEETLAWLPPMQAAEQIALAPNGERIAYVADGARLFLRSITDAEEIYRFQLPATSGRYQSVSWANRMDRLAVVEESEDVQRIWLIEASTEGGQQASSRLLIEEKGVKFSTPDWSPDNCYVAYTRQRGNEEEIWVNSTVSLEASKVANGSQPAWSPDGKAIAYVHEGTVTVLELASGKIEEVGPGEWPDWISEKRLVFTTPNRNLAEARLDQKPVEIASLSIPKPIQDKVVRTRWSSNQKDVLIAYESVQSIAFSVAKRH
jgi:TolB protein